ncbi:MAG: Na/Pi cotransporter family protein [Oscillospiraceae bacterium]|nr:Na/Pi cotransporter family protein [Oscillospiraceae bacterium]
MSVFDFLTMIGGVCLFLFGMNVMGEALEKRAGKSLKTILSRITSNKITGFLLGLGVTAVIQSSGATTVMVVGFVNSGLMTLSQAINVIMGANVGTTVTAWILSLTGVSGSSLFVQMLKPSSFTPILGLIGIIFYMGNNAKRKDTGMILLGFATLMFGMDIMSDAVSGLKDVPEFQNLMIMFSNPIMGVIVGAVMTGIIQSSSASVGILQALSSTGQIPMATAIPIIMGQNIGSCVPAMISSVGTNKNARRTALVHLSFNIIGTVFWVTIFVIVKAAFAPAILNLSANQFTIAVAHSAFNILCTCLMLPMSGLLEKLAYAVIKDTEDEDAIEMIDERLMATPSVALEQCHRVVCKMAEISNQSLKDALILAGKYDRELAEKVRADEDKVDRYEDMLGSYLVKLSNHTLTEEDRAETAELLHLIGDFERISDHAVNILESAEEMYEKKLRFSENAQRELTVMGSAVYEILDLALDAFASNDVEKAKLIEPLEEVVDTLKEQLRMRHIIRLQKGECTIEMGFVLSDMLTNLERVADHCSNVAGRIIEQRNRNIYMHSYTDNVRSINKDFGRMYDEYARKYALVNDI